MELTDLKSVKDYLTRIGAKVKSMRVAIITEMVGGYAKELGTIRFSDDGEIDVKGPDWAAPTDAEQAQIKADVSAADLPTLLKLDKVTSLPDGIGDERYEFRDAAGKFIMFTSRVKLDSGEKVNTFWTFWSDQKWRPIKPDGFMPLYGLDKVGDNTTVFIHEGEKAAHALQKIDPDHPWAKELSAAAHVGWAGGAASAHNTDWAKLRALAPKIVYIVADNDQVGKDAVSFIAKQLRCRVEAIGFTKEFPPAFDLADPFPKRMFSKQGKSTIYTGPSFMELLHPATFATKQIKTGGKGRPVTMITEEFRDLWAYLVETGRFYYRPRPWVNFDEAEFNRVMRPFSHVNNTSWVMLQKTRLDPVAVAYRPDLPSGDSSDGTKTTLNIYSGPKIKPVKGDVKPFLEFMDYLVPNESDCHQVMRWCATLIAKPEWRMTYGMLLISKEQGIGKSTLGERILGELIGRQNFRVPSESDIVESQFNGWRANNRLVLINEIYSGHSWKAYNKLKTVITDSEFDVNEKHQKVYTAQSWTHVLACSNSERALKIEDEDRRWFVPKLAPKKWALSKFHEFFAWLQSGGLAIIMDWALSFDDYVLPGEAAPDSELKREIIDDSLSDFERRAGVIGRGSMEDERPIVMPSDWIKDWVVEKGDGFFNNRQVNKQLVKAGLVQTRNAWGWSKGQIGRLWMNGKFVDGLTDDERGWLVDGRLPEVESEEAMELVKTEMKAKLLTNLLKPQNILEESM